MKNPYSEVHYTTKAGTPISLITPAKIRGEGKARYRLVQILPPVPQRFEWVHVYNIVVHENGTQRAFEEPAEVTLPASRV